MVRAMARRHACRDGSKEVCVSTAMSKAAMDRRRRRRLPEFSWSWFSIPSLLIAWVLVASQFPSYVLPQVWSVADEAYKWVIDGSIWPHLWASFLEEVGGFGAAIVVSVICGFLAGFFRPFREYMVPLNGLFMAIPPIAWAPLMLILFGIGYVTIVVVIFISAVNPMILTIMEGVLQIQGGEVRAARVLGARRWQLFVFVYLPASLPFVTAALRIGFSQAWRALVAAEMIGATKGLGWMVQMGGEVGNSRQVLLGIVLIGGFSYLFERLIFRQIEKRYEVWRAA
jgi:NitT/TauT family transport system permease protein/taurine transport system permease protein